MMPQEQDPIALFSAMQISNLDNQISTGKFIILIARFISILIN